jgi:hypothetical protein
MLSFLGSIGLAGFFLGNRAKELRMRIVRHPTPAGRVRCHCKWLRLAFLTTICGGLGLAAGIAAPPAATLAPPRELIAAPPGDKAVTTPLVVFGYNDLGMHCMNSDFSEIMVLPPFNNLHAQVIRRAVEPQIITSGVTVSYVIPANTHSADKTNFWRYPQALLGPAPAPNVGLTGNRLAGTMVNSGARDWVATGIPITPIDDTGRENPYSLATITVMQGSTLQARTQAVVPTSTEMSCILCHNRPGISTALDVLQRHDELHGTTLVQQRPVLCASCHSSNALGLPGDPNRASLSRAMHGAHASRMGSVNLPEVCYACHPGVRTKCQRDVHFSNGITCTNCHGDMTAVANPARTPWATEPRCDNCHHVAGHQYEQANTLFRNSVGHGGVHCSSCHGSPHAITPTVTGVDNAQALALQGHAGKIDTCTVCHTSPPGSFFHSVGD